jgi:BolA protein
MKEKIIEKLSKNLTIKDLQVINKSYLHQGHAGDNGTGESHFEVIIVADEFKSINRVSSHRRVKEILKDEFKNGLHALSIKIGNSVSYDENLN